MNSLRHAHMQPRYVHALQRSFDIISGAAKGRGDMFRGLPTRGKAVSSHKGTHSSGGQHSCLWRTLDI